MYKKIVFNNNIEIFTTYSSNEYDRSCIDHVLYRKAYQRISDKEMDNIYILLDIYKLYEMKVHKNSFSNNLYHTKCILN